ncbi:UTP--glucose-1-phosphate uridylyltransferase [Alkalihalobacillus sp. TS-13]|uniref:UTP--glucose-1-phosphate uridylyltransferase n=1 Tax=Alkalihalobacillus sp. TS-13 TaxID=2842455 RepID=UPI001C87A97F|nr:UTP--glucose-1-phosphate uridylyltransferase [Alkalihalobacillus sp. TS-13]
MIKKAIIPAAGYGTRSLPVTKVVPKEMFPIGGKPAIHYIVEEAVLSGIEEILIVVSKSKSIIVDYFDASLELEAFLEKNNKLHLLKYTAIPKVHIQYTRQPYSKGLGDAILHGKRFVGNEPFAVLLPDDIIHKAPTPALSQLISIYERFKGNVIGLNKVHPDLVSRYGVIDGDEERNDLFKINHIVEKPKSNAPSNLVVIGRYVFHPEIFNHIENLTPGASKEVELTDAIDMLLNNQDCYGKIIDGDRFDIGTDNDYIKLINAMWEGKE